MRKWFGDGSGFTLVELVTSAAVLGIVVLAVVNLFVFNINSVSNGKARAMALALANQQMEYLRDLPYASLATQTGTIYPPGNIADSQNITFANYKFVVKTKIVYVDDPYDGNATGTIPGKPTDLYPYDYKRAEITVLLATNNRQVAQLTSDVGAKAAETASNTGILTIKVFDANGQPVPNADVQITNTVPNPDVSIATTTDVTGVVVIPGLPPDSGQNYKIVASLPGYSTEQTSPDPAGAQTPVITNANVLVQQITNVTLAIDHTSTMNLHVVDTTGTAVSGQSIHVVGSKKIYTNPDVYKYDQTLATDASGNIALAGIEWDSYSFSVSGGKYIVTTSPYQPFTLAPNTSQTINLVVSSSSSYPTITSVNPNSDNTGSNPATAVISGTNLSGASVLLRMSGQADIVGTVTSSSGTSLTVDFNLATAASGNWDIVLTKSGNTITQTGGYNVTP